MSVIKKAICDNCSKEINYEDWYYRVGDIIQQSTSCDKGARIFKESDLCEECYKKIFHIQHGFIKSN